MKNATKYYLTTFATCIIGITVVLSHANAIDDINPRATENNAAQTHSKANGGIINSNTDCNLQQLTNKAKNGMAKNG